MVNFDLLVQLSRSHDQLEKYVKTEFLQVVQLDSIQNLIFKTNDYLELQENIDR